MARIKVADLRRIENLTHQEEISYSKGVEMLNEIASNYSGLNNYEDLPSMRVFFEHAKAAHNYDDFIIRLGRPSNDGKNTVLKTANEMLRSLYSVVERRGKDTNWVALEKRLTSILKSQHKIMYGSYKIDSEPTSRT